MPENSPGIGDDPEVLLLSEMTGQNVLRSDGAACGRVADLTMRLNAHADSCLVERILVRRRHRPDVLLPWAAIESFEHTGLLIRGGHDPTPYECPANASALGDDEILLVRDVLDTQIVDVKGKRLARVADVVLTRRADARLEVVGVEVGLGALLRRLGLRRLAAHLGEDVVAVTDLHLTSERGHTVQLATAGSAVHQLDAAGLAALVSRLDIESATEVLAASGPHVAADVVRAADPTVGERLLRAMPNNAVEKIVAAMPVKHASHWRGRLAHTPTLRGRRFLRSRRWSRRHRPPVSTGLGNGGVTP